MMKTTRTIQATGCLKSPVLRLFVHLTPLTQASTLISTFRRRVNHNLHNKMLHCML